MFVRQAFFYQQSMPQFTAKGLIILAATRISIFYVILIQLIKLVFYIGIQ
jgi:hypothetical protein